MSWLNRHSRVVFYHCGWRITCDWHGVWKACRNDRVGYMTSNSRGDLFRRIEAVEAVFELREAA